MAENLRLTLILQARDRAVEVIKRAFEAVRRETAGSSSASRTCRSNKNASARSPGGGGHRYQGQPFVLHGAPPDGKRPRPKRASHGVQTGFF